MIEVLGFCLEKVFVAWNVAHKVREEAKAVIRDYNGIGIVYAAIDLPRHGIESVREDFGVEVLGFSVLVFVF